MAKVAVFTDDQRRWLEFDEDTELFVSFLSTEKGRELSKEVDKLTVRSGGDRSVIWNRKLGEKVLHGWRHKTRADHPGLTLPDGSPIPFTPESRDLLMVQCREISMFVSENCLDSKIFIEEQKQADRREETKND